MINMDVARESRPKGFNMKRIILRLEAGIVLATGILTSVSAQRPAARSIPNLAGKILTVAGPIDPVALGQTLMHEKMRLFRAYLDEPQKKLVTLVCSHHPLHRAITGGSRPDDGSVQPVFFESSFQNPNSRFCVL
jgi:predicted metal-dependent phosphotriesterase family hydrolase